MKRRADELQLNFAIVSRRIGKSRSWLNTSRANEYDIPANMRTLSELLGHSDVAFTMQVYGHTDDTMKAAAMERIHNVGKASKDKNTASDDNNV